MHTEYMFAQVTTPTPLRGFRHRVVVHDFETALLYRHGRRVGRLGPGRHVRWGRGFAVARVDLRRQALAIAGQEVLSADNVGLKVSVAVTFQIAEPEKVIDEAQDWRTHLYTAVQLALRTTIASRPVESLLANRLAVGGELLAAVRPEAAAVGVALHAVEVKDVMFPGDLKRVFAEVLRARQEGQAALERARGESAALRNLANAARLLEANPALQNLRLLQSITAAGAAGNTLVMSLPAGFVPLPAARSVPAKPGVAGEPL
jgi:regulator of protease activity HflC (stomatin/prohibitin superfamily)